VIAELRKARGNDGANAWRREHADEFQELIAKQQLETEAALDLRAGERVFFDRGLFDGLAYAKLAGVAPPPSVLAARGTHRYDLVVLCRLILPFKERPHSGRMSDRARAEAIERGLEEAWSGCGYPVLHLPSNLAPRERAELLLDRIAVWPPGLRPGERS
jgi:predicted ATPase